MEDAGVPRVGSYCWTATGAVLSAGTKQAAQELVKVFPDCATSIGKAAPGRNTGWRVTVDFPVAA